MPHCLQDVDLWFVDSLLVPASLHDVRAQHLPLEVHTRPEAIAAARRLGLLAPPALGPQPLDPGTPTE